MINIPHQVWRQLTRLIIKIQLSQSPDDETKLLIKECLDLMESVEREHCHRR